MADNLGIEGGWFEDKSLPMPPTDKARVAYLESALRKIAEGRGRFSQDQLTFAGNTIESMKEIANAALAGTWGLPDAD